MSAAGRAGPGLILALVLVSVAPAPPAAGQHAPAPPVAAALPTFDLDGDGVERWRLPSGLREASGLALDTAGRLLVHDDEQARVATLDPRTGEVLEAFTLGAGAVRGDFEGIARAGARLFLTTSTGTLVAFRAGRNGEAVPFEAVPTGLGARCEIEGLAWDATTGLLLLPCKRPLGGEAATTVLVFGVPADRLDDRPRVALEVPLEALDAVGLDRRFRPSAVEVHPTAGTIVLLSGQDRALLEVTRDGRVLAGARLPRRHRQAEGLAFGSDGALFLVDEGEGGRARLTRVPAAVGRGDRGPGASPTRPRVPYVGPWLPSGTPTP